MRSWLPGGVIGLVVLAGGASAEPPKATGWLKDFETAKATAARSGKPMLVVFR
jgi:hypothetical protein